MNKQIESGFTLVELMIVVTIIGVIAALAAPSYQRTIEKNQLKQAVESLKADMQFARTEAIKRSADVYVSRENGNSGSWCYGLSLDDCDCEETNTSESDYCSIKIVSGSEFSATNLNSSDADSKFSFRRGTIGANGVTFSTDHYVARVVFSSVGRVKLCTPASGTLDRPAGTTGLDGIPNC